MDDKQELLISGVEEIGVTLREISLSVSEILETVSNEMVRLQGDSILLGEVSTGLLAKFSEFQDEFPHFIKEIDNYSDFMTETLKSYQKTDDDIETKVKENLNAQIEQISTSGVLAGIGISTASSSPLYDVDPEGNVDLHQVNPALSVKMNQLVDECKKEGINIRVTADLRSVDEQNNLYNSGRSKDGSIVTNAKGEDYESSHQWGTAFDVAIQGNDPYNIEKLERVGEIGKSLGLEWGGDFKEFPDMPHFELPQSEAIKGQYQNPAEFADQWLDETL